MPQARIFSDEWDAVYPQERKTVRWWIKSIGGFLLFCAMLAACAVPFYLMPAGS